jgi:hypothetical protein
MLLRGNIKRLGYAIARASEWAQSPDHLDLTGDRDIEWAWTVAHLPERPGRVLDVGPSNAFTPLVSAFKATEVIALDLDPPPVPFRAPNLVYLKGDVIRGGLPNGKFDTIVNCSTTEHIGLSGRYGNLEDPEGDFKAMAALRQQMSGPTARMILTVPVGRDMIARPYHRIYGVQRLPRILSGFCVIKEAYYAKPHPPNVWIPVTKDVALSIQGSSHFYSLGLFVLAAAA